MVNDDNDKWANEQDLPINSSDNIEQSENPENSKEKIIDSINKQKIIKEQIKESKISKEEKLTNNEQSSKIDKKSDNNSNGIITRSDLQDIKNILQDIAKSTEEFAGFLKSKYDEKGYEDISKGTVHTKRYKSYYDVFHTITTAGPIDPNDFDSPVYNTERIFEATERYSDIVFVSNVGTDTLFVIISHGGRTNFSQEAPIFPGEVKTYYNVYELRLRSPTAGLPYRVTEYDLASVFNSTSVPVQKAVIHVSSLPAANTNWLTSDITPTSSPTTFGIDVAVSIAGIFSAQITRGGVATIVNFNTGNPLTAGAIYHFSIKMFSGDTINFQYSATGGTIQILRVQEVDTAVA